MAFTTVGTAAFEKLDQGPSQQTVSKLTQSELVDVATASR